MDMPRGLDEISEAANANKIFAGRCFRIISQELGISSTSVETTNDALLLPHSY